MQDVTFLNKSYGGWAKVKNHVFIHFSNSGPDDQDDKPVLENNINSYNSDSDDRLMKTFSSMKSRKNSKLPWRPL